MGGGGSSTVTYGSPMFSGGTPLKTQGPMLHRGDNFFSGGTPLQNPEHFYGGGGLGSNPALNDTYKYQLLSGGQPDLSQVFHQMFGGSGFQ